MSTPIQRIGPSTPPNDPRQGSSFGEALESYAGLFAHPNPSNANELKTIAQKTVELSRLAQSVMHAASPIIRTAADGLEKMLTAPLSVAEMPKQVSILTAAEHYLNDPATAELGPLVQELCQNEYALHAMCRELTDLSAEIKNPNAPGGSHLGA